MNVIREPRNTDKRRRGRSCGYLSSLLRRRTNRFHFSGPRPLQQNSGHLRGCVESGGDPSELGQAPLVLVPLPCLPRDAPGLDFAGTLQEV